MRRNFNQKLNKSSNYTKDYEEFKESQDNSSSSFYERLAHYVSSKVDLEINNIGLFENRIDNIENNIKTARMEVSRGQFLNLLIVPTVLMVLISLILFSLSTNLGVIGLMATFFYIYWAHTFPAFKADVTKIMIADESLDLMLYLSMNLRTNPSLVDAVRKASINTGGHLGRDLSDIMWHVETDYGKTVSSELSSKMEDWRRYSSEFVESLGFLMDSTSQRGEERNQMIDRGQSKMIGDIKEKMNQYARDLSSPVKVLNMMGVMLPLMGLIMFPLITIFLGGENSVGGLTLYVSIGYIVILPLFLFYFVKRLVSRRPGAYSQPTLNHVKDLPPKDKIILNVRGKKYKFPLLLTSLIIGGLIALPGILYYLNLFLTMAVIDTTFIVEGGSISGVSEWSNFIEQQYMIENLVPNVLTGMTLIWGITAGLITFFYGRSYRRIQIREEIDKIEDKMILALTELQNEVSKNKPIEKCFNAMVKKLDRSGLQNHPLKEFFEESFAEMNLRNKPFEEAIYGKDLIYDYPSPLLINTMDVIKKSVSLGPNAVENNISNIRMYVQNKEDVESTINKLLDGVVGQMELQAKYIAPVITAVAGGLALVIVEVLFALSQALDEISQTLSVGGQSSINVSENVALIQNLDQALPPTILILITGTYLVEVSLILSYFTNGIENGFDEISRDIKTARFLLIGITIYSLILIITTVFVTPQIPDLISVS